MLKLCHRIKAQMTSKSKLPTNANGNEDPHKSEGRIELRIENFAAAFVQEETGTERRSAPVYVRGVAWKILATPRESERPAAAQSGQKQKCLGFFLECNERCTDPFWSYFASAKLKIVAQKEGKVDHVRECSHIFCADRTDWGWPQFMTFEVSSTDLMNPDKGFYDEQSDSIVLAVDLAGVGEYVAVAQNELKLDKAVQTRFSLHFAQMEWEIKLSAAAANNNKNAGEKSLVLSCKNMAKGSRGRVDKLLLVELFAYCRDDPKHELYSPMLDKIVAHHHLFTSKHASMTVKVPGESDNNILTTVRVWKERSQFPDFTKPTAVVGRFPSDVTLRVGDQQFHVNKLLLSSHSLFFDRMFNGGYDAARQQEVELSLNTQSAEAFHHFLIVLCVNEALPNSMNVAELFKLADFYDAEGVRTKCDQHLRMAREMPIEDRVLLARDHCSKETQALIVDSANVEQSKALNMMFLEHRCPKH